MLIPPILEIFVVWHPADTLGAEVSRTFLEHFHGTAFSGLVGGAVEVYVRSEPWDGTGAPRPLPYMSTLPNDLPPAAVTVVVPVLGLHLLRAVEDLSSGWSSYIEELAAGESEGVLIVPARAYADTSDPDNLQAMAIGINTRLGQLLGHKQALLSTAPGHGQRLCRDLAHEITQFVSSNSAPLRVFLSHTKHWSDTETRDVVTSLVDRVRSVLNDTKLVTFYDETSLRPGQSWADELVEAAASSAVLAVRTDRYAGREWCQKEILSAKRADVPIVVLHALGAGEDRGSFLMDNVPTVACPIGGSNEEVTAQIEVTIDKLVDEALKRALWRQQEARLECYGFDWLPANAPEPITVSAWLRTHDHASPGANLQVMHPDPPLGPPEVEALADVFSLAGLEGRVDVLTPRTFATRGGQVR